MRDSSAFMPHVFGFNDNNRDACRWYKITREEVEDSLALVECAGRDPLERSLTDALSDVQSQINTHASLRRQNEAAIARHNLTLEVLYAHRDKIVAAVSAVEKAGII